MFFCLRQRRIINTCIHQTRAIEVFLVMVQLHGLISYEGFAEIGEFSLGTDGSGANNLIVKTGSARQKDITGKYVEDDEGHIWYDDYLYMNGGAIFNFTLDAVPTMMADILAKNQLEKDDIDYYVFHQANKFMLNTIRKVCVLPKDRFYVNLTTTGNTVSSTVLIGLKDCIENKIIRSGEKGDDFWFWSWSFMGWYDFKVLIR